MTEKITDGIDRCPACWELISEDPICENSPIKNDHCLGCCQNQCEGANLDD